MVSSRRAIWRENQKVSQLSENLIHQIEAGLKVLGKNLGKVSGHLKPKFSLLSD